MLGLPYGTFPVFDAHGKGCPLWSQSNNNVFIKKFSSPHNWSLFQPNQTSFLLRTVLNFCNHKIIRLLIFHPSSNSYWNCLNDHRTTNKAHAALLTAALTIWIINLQPPDTIPHVLIQVNVGTLISACRLVCAWCCVYADK